MLWRPMPSLITQYVDHNYICTIRNNRFNKFLKRDDTGIQALLWWPLKYFTDSWQLWELLGNQRKTKCFNKEASRKCCSFFSSQFRSAVAAFRHTNHEISGVCFVLLESTLKWMSTLKKNQTNKDQRTCKTRGVTKAQPNCIPDREKEKKKKRKKEKKEKEKKVIFFSLTGTLLWP